MKILYLSGITGESGIGGVSEFLQQQQYDIIVGGVDTLSYYSRGIDARDIETLLDLNFSVLCGGNYSYAHPSSRSVFSKYKNLLRAYNLYEGAYGASYFICKDILFVVFLGIENNVNVFGRSEFPFVHSPFTQFDELCNTYPDIPIIVDYHGGSFAEKRVFAEYVKDRATAVIGSHYNVQTADEQIIGTCAYISDAGFCGSKHSVFGLGIDACIKKYTTLLPSPIPREGSTSTIVVQGVELNVNGMSPQSIQRISYETER